MKKSAKSPISTSAFYESTGYLYMKTATLAIIYVLHLSFLSSQKREKTFLFIMAGGAASCFA